MAVKKTEVRVSLQDKATAELNKINATVNNLSKSFLNLGGSFGNIASLGGASLLGSTFLKMSKDWSKAVDDLSVKTGMATEETSKLLYVGRSMGVTTETMSEAMTQMGKSVSNAHVQLVQANAAGRVSNDVFSKFGIAINDTNGKMLSSEKILRNIIEVHRRMPNGIAKTNMEMEIFGQKGTQLNDILKLSDDEFQKLIKNAEKSGHVIGTNVTQAWKRFEEAQNRLMLAGEGFGIQIGTALLPKLESYAKSLESVTSEFDALSPQTKGFIADAIELTAAVSALALAFKALAALSAPFMGAGGVILGSAAWTYTRFQERQAEAANVMRNENLRLAHAIAGYDPVSDALSQGNNIFLNAPKAERKLPQLDSPNIAAGGGGGGGSNKANQMAERYRKLLADINEKIVNETGTTYEIGIARMQKEMAKYGEDMEKIRAQGIDTTDLETKMAEYQKIMQETLLDDQRKALRDLVNETATAYSQIQGIKAENARLERETALNNIADEIKDRKKAAGDIVAVKQWAAAQREKVERDYQQRLRSIQAEEHNNAMERAELLINLEGKTQKEVDSLMSEQLRKYKTFLQNQLLNAQLNADERLEIERQLNSAIAKEREISTRTLDGGIAEAMRRIKEQSTDYASMIKGVYDDLDNTVSGHFSDMMTHNESFSTSMKNIYKDLTNAILDMWAKIIYQQLIYKPLQNMFGGLFGGMFGGGGLGMGSFGISGAGAGLIGFAEGGLIRGAGTATSDNILIAASPGEGVLTARAVSYYGGEEFIDNINALRYAKGGIVGQSGGFPSNSTDNKPIEIRVINQTQQDAAVTQQSASFDGERVIIDIVMSAVSRNVNNSQNFFNGIAKK